jgi:hypothetical protein
VDLDVIYHLLIRYYAFVKHGGEIDKVGTQWESTSGVAVLRRHLGDSLSTVQYSYSVLCRLSTKPVS